jgi:hypothetical protein
MITSSNTLSGSGTPNHLDGALVHAMSGNELSRVRTCTMNIDLDGFAPGTISAVALLTTRETPSRLRSFMSTQWTKKRRLLRANPSVRGRLGLGVEELAQLGIIHFGIVTFIERDFWKNFNGIDLSPLERAIDGCGDV